MGRTKSMTFFMVMLLLLVSLPNPNTVSADTEVDNWPQTDAWLRIDLISWTANDSVEWDNNGGLPDPKFKVCVEADGDRLDCVNTPTWDNQLTLNNSWNYTIDIPDDSNILNITIECKDNDAFNSDECDMNSDVNYWRLYAEYNWSQNPNMTIVGSGDGDGDDTWKNAASIWKFTIDGYGDEDGDGVSDNIDVCPTTTQSFGNVNQTVFPGCSWGQLDFDADGVENSEDIDFQNFQITTNFPFLFENYNSNTPEKIEIEGITGDINHLSYIFFKTIDGSEFLIQASGENQIIRISGDAELHFHTTNGELPSIGLGSSKQLDIDYDGDLDLIVSATSIFLNENNTLVRQDITYSEYNNRNSHCGTDYEILDFDKNGIPDFYCDGHILLNFGYTSDSTESQVIQVCNEKPGQENEFHYEENTDSWLFVCLEENERGTDWVDHNITRVSRQGAYLSSHLLRGISSGPYRTGFFGDFNNDGFIDYIHEVSNTTNRELAISFSNDQSWYNPTNIGEFPYWYPNEASSFDIDLDGDVDVLSSDGRALIQGEFSFEYVKYQIPGDDIKSTIILDYDNDGDLDYLYAGQWNSIHGLLLVRDPSFPDSDNDGISDTNDICPDSIAEDEVDQDGCSDLQRDTDLDGVRDADDSCPNTTTNTTVNSVGCSAEQIDSDGDGINDEMDVCPTTPNGETVNLEGCSQSQIDSDDDGVVNSNDTCPNTISSSAVDENGCSDAQLDPDSDGVIVTLDRCPDTPRGAEVSYYGCSANQGDEDLDGVLNEDDECPNSRFVDTDKPPEASDGCDGWFESRDDDDDGDGLVNSYDDCPNTPSGQLIDGDGCSSAQREELANGSSSEFDFGAALIGPICVLGIIGLVVILSPKNKKRNQHIHVNLQASTPVVVQQNVSAPQISPRERHLEDQSRQAQFEAQRLRQELTNQAQITQRLQSEAAQKQISDAVLAQKQQELAIAQKEKQDLEAKLAEAEKSTQIVQNITYNITDSAISGDITNKISRNDIE